MAGSTGPDGTKLRAWMGADHRGVLALVLDLEGAADGAARVSRLAALDALLEEHFAREEAPGGLDALVEGAAPRLIEKVASLRREHREILARIRTIQRLLAGPPGSGDGPATAEIEKLCRTLRAHEAAENGMLLDALDVELGSGD